MSVFQNDDSSSSAAYTQHLKSSNVESSNPFGSSGDGFRGSVSESSSSPKKASFVDVKPDNGRAAAIAALAPPAFEFSDEKNEEGASKHGKITVGEPELRKANFLASHHVYPVSCSAGSVQHVYRRYSDFVWLRTVLVKSFPGLFIPPLPPKQVLGSKDSSFVEGRRMDLQRWLLRIISRPFLAEHAAVNLFLQRATPTFESEQKELLKQAENKTTSETIAHYIDLFPEIARLPRRDDSAEVESELEVTKEFLLASEKKLNEMLTANEKLVSSTQLNVTNLSNFTTLFQASLDGEKSFLSGLPRTIAKAGGVFPRVDLTDSLAAWHLSAKWSSNSIEELVLNPLRFEHQDLEAMIELFKIRTELHGRHVKSVAKATKWQTAGNAPKNEKQEAQRIQDDQTAKDEGTLLDLINKLILNTQIESFWSYRMKSYKRRMNSFAKIQMDSVKQLYDTFAAMAASTAGDD